MLDEKGSKCVLRLLGVNMTLAGLATIGLGIADLVLTYQWWCVNWGLCGTLNNTLVLTWVGIAIWAPVPIFLNGIAAVRFAGRTNGDKGFICVFSFINTVAFAPGIVVITALEQYFKFPGGLSANIPNGTPSSTVAAMTAIYAIELTIIIVGGVLFLHVLIVLYLTCCCGSSKEQVSADHYDHNQFVSHILPPPPQQAAPPAGFVNYGADLGPRAAFYPALARVPNLAYGGQPVAGALYGYGNGAGALRQW